MGSTTSGTPIRQDHACVIQDGRVSTAIRECVQRATTLSPQRMLMGSLRLMKCRRLLLEQLLLAMLAQHKASSLSLLPIPMAWNGRLALFQHPIQLMRCPLLLLVVSSPLVSALHSITSKLP